MKRLIALVAAIVLIGGVLRFVWGEDIEYKYDEQRMFELSQHVGTVEPWPFLGMRSGVGFRNPGLSVWVFVAAGRLFSIDTPTGLARAVQAMNVVALALLGWFALTSVPRAERGPWLWGAALVAVNPFAVLLHRKIWIQSVLPLFCLLAIFGWWRRDTRWGAFLWGFIGACLGQIHMSGLLFAPALVLATAAAPWLASRGLIAETRPVRWRSWWLGSALGLLPITPWILYMCFVVLVLRDGTGVTLFDPHRMLDLAYWKHLGTNTFGLRLDYSLGGDAYREFLSYPQLGDTSTYLVLACQYILWAGLASVLVWIVARSCMLLLRRGPWNPPDTNTDLLLFGGCILFGALFTVLGISIHWHYLTILFALPFVLLARIVLAWRKAGTGVLVVVTAAQLVVSGSLLQYIHLNGGAPDGDYGTAYSHQQASATDPLR